MLLCEGDEELEHQLAIITACSCEMCSFEPAVMSIPEVQESIPSQIRREIRVEELIDNLMGREP